MDLAESVESTVNDLERYGFVGQSLSSFFGHVEWERVGGEVVEYRIQLVGFGSEELGVPNLVGYTDSRFGTFVSG